MDSAPERPTLRFFGGPFPSVFRELCRCELQWVRKNVFHHDTLKRNSTSHTRERLSNLLSNLESNLLFEFGIEFVLSSLISI